MLWIQDTENKGAKVANRLLEVMNLKTSFYTPMGEVQAVRGISFKLNKGEVLGVVGESGSGKSVMAHSIMRLIDPPGKIIKGSIVLEGVDLMGLTEKEMCKVRGNTIAMVFQDPTASLNPVFSIGNQIVEAIMTHQVVNKREARIRAIEMLTLVGIPSPERTIDSYPHELSGGMRQRVMIAMALSCKPKLMIADEPTSALDVTIQAQILDLLDKLREKLNTSILLITHDFGVVAEFCSRVIVMYGGLIVEEGTVDQIFHDSKHPYTLALLKAVPGTQMGQSKRLVSIEGSPPDLSSPPSGCPFFPRCPYAMKICSVQMPPFFEVEQHHKSLCWRLHPEAPSHVDFITR